MEKRKPTVSEMLDMYKQDWELFYLPYGNNREDVEATYKWRKKILEELNKELDKQYQMCYNEV